MDRGLYFCVPFREQLLKYYEKVKNPDVEENLLTCLAELFTQISTQKKKIGVIAPKRFVQRVKKENELFRGYMHQDAHEFLNFLLNELVDILEKETKGTKEHSSPPEKIPNGIHVPLANGVRKEPLVTWVHKNFQGILTNETKCLRCETVTARDETLLDPSLDIEQNNSITSCLKNFSSTETLNGSTEEDEDQETAAYFSDTCRKYAKSESVIFHYNGHGAPKPTTNDRIPGRQTDRKKLLGELNWRSAFIDYSLDCSPVSYPMLPPTHQHHMWDAWDMAAEIYLSLDCSPVFYFGYGLTTCHYRDFDLVKASGLVPPVMRSYSNNINGD
ncbi:unnamed protein product [Lactuca saligna]|uniref:USP domain-containing protein n=1 Tax=Lactuca saligna TaxID=75948 RepID=A0AA35Z1C5_LACSI|nr:unnamed protein product [Lactuca saligna]